MVFCKQPLKTFLIKFKKLSSLHHSGLSLLLSILRRFNLKIKKKQNPQLSPESIDSVSAQPLWHQHAFQI